jgi:acyl-CoA dehydrogenase
LHLEGKLDAPTASMAKCWVTDLENKIVDECLQLFGGYGYMSEYPISRIYRDSRVQHLWRRQRDHEGVNSTNAVRRDENGL